MTNHANGYGGGLMLASSNGDLDGARRFISNTAYYGVGALYSEYSSENVEADGRFTKNSAKYGGGIAIMYAVWRWTNSEG